MSSTKIKSNSLLFIIFASILLLGTTLAWFGYETKEETNIIIYSANLDTTISLTSNLNDINVGDTIVSNISFARQLSSSACYVRARLEYTSEDTLTDDVKDFLLSVNYADVATYTGVDYKWVRYDDGYYYLTDLSGNPFEISNNNTDTITFCSNVLYTGAVSLYGTITKPTTLTLSVVVQAVQSKNVTGTSLATLSPFFVNTYGNESPLGYIVAFNTNGGNDIVAQTFYTLNAHATVPTPPIKDGFTFDNWYTEPEFTNVFDFTNTTITKNMTLYAKYI